MLTALTGPGCKHSLVPVPVCAYSYSVFLKQGGKLPEQKRSDRIAEAIIEAVRSNGPAVRKRDEVHQIADTHEGFVRCRF